MLHFFRREIRNALITDASPLPVGVRAYRQRVLVTRPGNATPYSAGDVIGAATPAAFEVPLIGPEGGIIQLGEFMQARRRKRFLKQPCACLRSERP